MSESSIEAIRAYPLPVGLQLVVNRSEFKFSLTFRDRMNAERLAYNQLKRQACDLNEDDYRRAKSDFIGRVLNRRKEAPGASRGQQRHFLD